ncbi:MAG: fasciclin domain-containing protein [Candidatus Krumholzibacteriia bacterium]
MEAKAILPLAEEAGFTTLVAAVKAAGLGDALAGDGPFTVFALTDEAFAKLPEGTVESLLANPEALKKVLLYHVVSGSVMAADVVKLEGAETLNGARVAIDATDGVKINGSTVIKADIRAANGVVHVIDTVLIPENL